MGAGAHATDPQSKAFLAVAVRGSAEQSARCRDFVEHGGRHGGCVCCDCCLHDGVPSTRSMWREFCVRTPSNPYEALDAPLPCTDTAQLPEHQATRAVWAHPPHVWSIEANKASRDNARSVRYCGQEPEPRRGFAMLTRVQPFFFHTCRSFENPMRKAASAASAAAAGSPRSSSMPRQTLQLGNGVVELPSMASRVGAASVNGHRQTAYTNGGVGAGAGAARAHGSSSGSSTPGRRKGRRHSSYTASPRSHVRGSGDDTALAASSPLANEAGAVTAASPSPPPPLAGRSTGIGAIGKNLTQS